MASLNHIRLLWFVENIHVLYSTTIGVGESHQHLAALHGTAEQAGFHLPRHHLARFFRHHPQPLLLLGKQFLLAADVLGFLA